MTLVSLKIARIGCHCHAGRNPAKIFLRNIQNGLNFIRIVCPLQQIGRRNHLERIINHCLTVVTLLKRVGAVRLHDPGVGDGKIPLILVGGHGRRKWAGRLLPAFYISTFGLLLFLDHIQDEMSQVSLGEPVQERGREQQHLLAVAGFERLFHSAAALP
jgi:hypothetical protein